MVVALSGNSYQETPKTWWTEYLQGYHVPRKKTDMN